MSNNRHHQRWTPADTDGRSLPSQACRNAGSPHRDLASGRRGHHEEATMKRPPVLPNWAVDRQDGARCAAPGGGRQRLASALGRPRRTRADLHASGRHRSVRHIRPGDRCCMLASSLAVEYPARGGVARALATLARLACDRIRRLWTCCPLARGGRLRGNGQERGPAHEVTRPALRSLTR